jgi:hypothetical protein
MLHVLSSSALWSIINHPSGWSKWPDVIAIFFQEGIPLSSASFYADITREQFAHILRSDSEYEMPMFEERLQGLQQAGKCLTEVGILLDVQSWPKKNTHHKYQVFFEMNDSKL